MVDINDLPEELSSLSFLFVNNLKIVNSSAEAEDLTADLYVAALLASQWDTDFSRTN